MMKGERGEFRRPATQVGKSPPQYVEWDEEDA
jgi:hypothetical protein